MRRGRRLFIDYAGTTVPILDPKTRDVVLDAQIFVSVLWFSNYVFSEATANQELSGWIGSHVHCFEFLSLGAVPSFFVPDNLKIGISISDLYNPSSTRPTARWRSTTLWQCFQIASNLQGTRRPQNSRSNWSLAGSWPVSEIEPSLTLSNSTNGPSLRKPGRI